LTKGFLDGTSWPNIPNIDGASFKDEDYKNEDEDYKNEDEDHKL
jgi:hypothetical protein